MLSGRGMRFLVGAMLAAMAPCAWAAKTCDVREFGAKGDGKTKDTAAIQKAIDACDVVKLSGGTYLSGPILLKSGSTLDVEKGATLLGSADMADYPKVTFARQTTVQPLVSAVNAENIVIHGGGVIDGNGQVWWDYVKGV
jgi:polygalacturonase